MNACVSPDIAKKGNSDPRLIVTCCALPDAGVAGDVVAAGAAVVSSGRADGDGVDIAPDGDLEAVAVATRSFALVCALSATCCAAPSATPMPARTAGGE